MDCGDLVIQSLSNALDDRLTIHSTGRAISKPLIENLRDFGGLCAPVNSGVRFLLHDLELKPRIILHKS